MDGIQCQAQALITSAHHLAELAALLPAAVNPHAFPKAILAAEALSSDGLSVEVIDPRTLAPLDIDTIVESVKKTGRLVIVHLAHKTGGVGAEIAQQVTELAFDSLDGPVVRVASADVPVGASQFLEKALFPDVPDIISACKSFRR